MRYQKMGIYCIVFHIALLPTKYPKSNIKETFEEASFQQLKLCLDAIYFSQIKTEAHEIDRQNKQYQEDKKCPQMIALLKSILDKNE